MWSRLTMTRCLSFVSTPTLKDTDVVDVVIRSDARVLASFGQSEVEIAKLGSKVVRVKDIATSGDDIFTATDGDLNEVRYNDASFPYPFDTIVVDREPPSGCLKITDQLDASTVKVAIKKPESGDYDEVSGIESMVLSAFSKLYD